MRLRRIAAAAVTATTLGIGLVALDAAPSFAVTCSGGNVYVDGRVKDTDADGYCVQVKAQINGVWHYSAKACPSGTTKYFSWSGPGNTAYVYTYLV